MASNRSGMVIVKAVGEPRPFSVDYESAEIDGELLTLRYKDGPVERFKIADLESVNFCPGHGSC
jgi:hypothetical protein